MEQNNKKLKYLSSKHRLKRNWQIKQFITHWIKVCRMLVIRQLKSQERRKPRSWMAVVTREKKHPLNQLRYLLLALVLRYKSMGQFLSLERDQVFMLFRKSRKLNIIAQRVENTMLLKLLNGMLQLGYYLIKMSLMSGLLQLNHRMMIRMLWLGLVHFKRIQIMLRKQSKRKQIMQRRQ